MSKELKTPSEKESVKDILLKYVVYLPFFIISTAVSVGTAYFYLHYANNSYKTSLKILVKQDDNGQNGDLASTVLAALSGNKINISNELEVIHSRTLSRKVVMDYSLFKSLFKVGDLNNKEIYNHTILSDFDFSGIKDSSRGFSVNFKTDGKSIFVLDGKNVLQANNFSVVKRNGFNIEFKIRNLALYWPGQVYKATWVSPDNAAGALVAAIDAKQLVKETSILDLSCITEVPLKGQDILNGIAKEYSILNIENKNSVVDNTIKFVEDRLLLISGELGNVEEKLQKYRQDNNIIDIAAQSASGFAEINSDRSQMEAIQVKVQVADMLKSYLDDPKRKYDLVPSSLGFEDQTLTELVRDYNQTVLQREELLKTVSPENIEVINFNAQLEQLQAKLIEAVGNVKKSLLTANAQLKEGYDKVMSQVNTVPQKQRELLEISRQQGIKEKLYLFLLERLEESGISKASAISNSNPIDPAITSGFPVAPNVAAIMALGFFCGIGLPLLWIFIKNVLNDKIITKGDVQDYTDVSVIGEINHSDNLERKIVANKTRGAIPEQFRVIRTNLQYFLGSQKKGTILVTSTMPGEGKTFISMNLAATLSLTGKKVLLLEFDLRKPKIVSALNIDTNTDGITSYIVGGGSIFDRIIAVPEFDNLFILPTGAIPPNPAELILNPMVDKMFDELKAHFDYLVIDTPPIGIVSDSKVLAKYSNVNIYVVRQRYTPKRHLELVNKINAEGALTNMALIINDIIVKGSDSYYGYSYTYGYNSYSYDYSYGYGYGTKDDDGNSILQRIRRFFSGK